MRLRVALVGAHHGRVLPRREGPGRAAVRRQHLPLRAGRLRGVDPARPHAVGRGLPAHPRRRDGRAAGAHHLDPGPLDHVAAGRVRARRRLHRPGAVHHLHPLRRHHRAVAARSPPSASTRPSTRWRRRRRSSPPRSSASATTTSPAACRRSCSATRSCRTSSPSSASTSCPRRTASRSTGPARCSGSCRSRSSSAEVFTGLPGINVPVEETVERFEQLVNGDLDDLPEQAFLNVGNADGARAKAKTAAGGLSAVRGRARLARAHPVLGRGDDGRRAAPSAAATSPSSRATRRSSARSTSTRCVIHHGERRRRRRRRARRLRRGVRQPGDDPLRRRRAARPDRRRPGPGRPRPRPRSALRADADDEDAKAALRRAEVRLEVAEGRIASRRRSTRGRSCASCFPHEPAPHRRRAARRRSRWPPSSTGCAGRSAPPSGRGCRRTSRSSARSTCATRSCSSALDLVRRAAADAAPLRARRSGPATTFAPVTPTVHLAVGGATAPTRSLALRAAIVGAAPLDRPEDTHESSRT